MNLSKNKAAQQLGKRGGKKTASKYGKDYFKKIGKKGAIKRWNKDVLFKCPGNLELFYGKCVFEDKFKE